ncbi:hypothetical protein CQW49_08420 [Methylosinus trichosporium OB3b]|uniref:Uncharacterized protein n=1 Tax=Methylosinus trichosporium (strain ATCC 35070 / NCIMB 11131 / UNIQEM 75 / OB3b) TaxID=595536 RepID=A0A2D2CYT7_METT3|nr:hypothetical protein CQW49_08420 [Methylosinus trichosporium OB3b]OBS54019.1 hypothetical protein A8B73_02895 [Methylosinus sp. 3S-1]
MNVVALEEHVRDASHLARVLFQFTRSLVNYSDTRDFDGLRTLADKTFDDAIAAEQLLDGRRVA